MRKSNKFLLFFLPALAFVFYAFVHEYHVCIYEINYNEDLQSLEIAQKVFIDDLERALEEAGYPPLKIGSEQEAKQTNECIAALLTSDFKLVIDHQEHPLKLVFVGKEWEDHHALWCYFEVWDLLPFEQLKIENRTFTDLFETQQNMHYISIGKHTQNVVLNHDKQQIVVDFHPEKK